jgi:c(7)-type cytochrome triheme protein
MAEEGGDIKLKDYIEGVSFKHDKLKDPAELTLRGGEAHMPDIIFSHARHARWSGCELCHPEIFGVKAGGTVYSMDDIFNGKYCGVCHDLVAFPNKDCQRCHTKEVY